MVVANPKKTMLVKSRRIGSFPHWSRNNMLKPLPSDVQWTEMNMIVIMVVRFVHHKYTAQSHLTSAQQQSST